MSIQQIKVQDYFLFLTCTISVIVAPITIEMRQNRNKFEMSRFIFIYLFYFLASTPVNIRVTLSARIDNISSVEKFQNNKKPE